MRTFRSHGSRGRIFSAGNTGDDSGENRDEYLLLELPSDGPLLDHLGVAASGDSNRISTLERMMIGSSEKESTEVTTIHST